MRAPSWLLLQLIALWPHAAWTWRRLQDGSDDPLGPLALAMLAVLLVMWRRRLLEAPRLPWLAAGAALTLAGAVATVAGPPLPAALLGVLGFAAGLVGWLPATSPRLAGRGTRGALSSVACVLAVLRRLPAAGDRGGARRPLVAGRRYRDGAQRCGARRRWPAGARRRALRPVCRWPGSRTSPPSPSRRSRARPTDGLLRRLPFVGAMVLAANALRNAVLVGLEARPSGLWPPLHEAIGAVVLAGLCASILARDAEGRSP